MMRMNMNMNDLRRAVNDIKYAESTSYHGKKLKREDARRVYRAESRAYREHEERVRRESYVRAYTRVTPEYIKTAVNISLIISSVISVALFLVGATSILESLALTAVGTGVLTFKSLT